MSEKKRQRNPVNDAQRANSIRPEPRNGTQARYIQAIEDREQIFALGPAGTGKTFIAASMAALLYLRRDIESIRLIRPAVAAGGEQHGFLPGKLENKMAPWAMPVVEILEEALGKQTVLEMQKSGELTVEPFTYMRGRTFRRSLIILDEAQNTTEAQMKLFVTRTGEDSKVIIDGDVQQSDLGSNNGLSWALNMVDRHDIPAAIVEFDHHQVERSKLAAAWVQAMEREEPG